MGFPLKGRKGSSGTSRKATRHDDSLFGQDTVEALLALSEGPIKGWPNGAADFFVGGVPLLDKAAKTPNISNFELRLLKGTNPADSIKLNLGGQASTVNVGLELRVLDQKIVVSGTKTQIDFIDVRFAVNRMVEVTDEGGEFPTDLALLVEVKPRSSSTWTIPFQNDQPPPDQEDGNGGSYRPNGTEPGTLINDAYRETYIAAAPPVSAKAVNAVWFDTRVTGYRPRLWDGAAWVAPPNNATTVRNGYRVWTWNDIGTNAARTSWYSPDGSAPPASALARGDYLLTPASGSEVYSYNDTSWVNFQEWANPPERPPGVIIINGLTRSTTPKEYRIPVPRINEPYDVRVTRQTPVSDLKKYRDVVFESIQEINGSVVSFPDLAIAWLTIKATDTFTSIPEFTSVPRGIMIPIPSNAVWDEANKITTFPGIWDGTFKLDYTTSPAWHAYNFIMNSRYGKNAYYPEVADKWDYYEFGKHCTAHKLRFNEYITEARPLNELINYVVGIAGGRYVDRGDGYSTVIWDADDQPALALFANENVEDGVFTYSFTDITERKNDLKVSFKNPELNYREDRIRVYDQNGIDVDGRNAEEFVAVGCRDPEEAVRRGRFRLATGLTEKTIVNFKTSRQGRYLQPFQVFLVADTQSSNVITGRVLNPDTLPVGTTQLPLRDQVYLEANIAYTVTFTQSDGNGGLKTTSYPITVTTPGQTSVLRLGRALSEPLMEYAVFSMGSPKAFRLTGMSPDESNPDLIEITGMEVNRQKWAYVDGLVSLRDILSVHTGPLSKFVYPVSGATITPQSVIKAKVPTLNLLVQWNASETKLIRGYRLYHGLDTNPMEVLYEGSALNYAHNNVEAGNHVYSIVAVGLDGTTESPPVTLQYSVVGSIRSVKPPTNLRLVDEPNAPLFAARDPRFTWDASPDPLVSRYRVEVVSPGGVTVSSTAIGSDLLAFIYPLVANMADNGGTPMRTFTVRVAAVDTKGNRSPFVSLVVSHPAPAAIVPALSTTGTSVIVAYQPPAGDIIGALMWMEKNSTFDPLATAVKYDGSINPYFLPSEKNTDYWVRVALYDNYGKTGLNISAPVKISTSMQIFDPNAPDIPAAPSLTTTLVKSTDGKVSANVRATWSASPSANFGSFELQIRLTSTGDWLPQPMGTNLAATITNLPPNTVFQAQLRAINADGFAKSGWSPTAQITTAANTAAPGLATAFTVSATFQTAYGSWTNPADTDQSGTDVFAGTTNVFANATKLMTVPGKGTSFIDPTLGATASKFYWVRPVNSSGVVATSPTGPVQATSAAITGAQLAAGVIDATKFATSLKPVELFATLPTTGNVDGRMVYNTTDKKLYRYDAAQAKFVASVAATDVAGQLSDAQLAGISAGKLVGQVVSAQLADASITMEKMFAGLSPIGTVSALPAVTGYTGPKVVLLSTDGKLYRLIGSAWVNQTPATDISGSIQSGQIAALEAGKVTGQLTSAQLAGIEAAKIGGQLTNAQIAGLDAAKVAGALTAATLPAGNVSGQIANSQLAAIEAGKITGQLTDAQIGALDAAKLVGSIVAGQLADNAISLSKIATGLSLLGEVTTLPAVSGYTGPKTVLNTTDGRIYRLVSGAWTSAVTAAEISGQLASGQLAAIEAGKITGALTSDQVAALDAAKLTGIVAPARIPALPAGSITGTLTDAQIAGLSAAKVSGALVNATLAAAGLTGTVQATQIAGLAAGQITGTLTNAQIAALDAAKLTGTVAPARIPALPAGSITGTLTDAQIAGLSAAKVSGALVNATLAAAGITGSVQATQIAGIEAGKITGALTSDQVAALDAAKLTGVVAPARIPVLPATAITGTLTNAQIAGLDAAKLTGSITSVQITDNAITAPKILAGAVTAGALAAYSVTASKLMIASQNRAFNADLAQGLLGIALGSSSFGFPVDLLYRSATDYSPDGQPSFYMRTAGTPNAGSAQQVLLRNVPAADGVVARYAVTPGQIYEFSIAIAALRCSVTANILWYDTNGSGLGSSGPNNSISVAQQIGSVVTFPRAWTLGVAPAGAVSAVLQVRAVADGGANPSVFGSCIMFASAITGQTEPSPYVDPGVTVIDGSSIRTGSLAADRIAANSITAGQIKTNAITADAIAANAVTANAILAGTITGDKLVVNAITAREIATDAVTAASIKAGEITGNKLVANTITALQIAGTTITANEIATNAITSDKILANSIIAGKIATDAVTADKIFASSITAIKIATDAVTADKILANSIIAGKIATNAVTANEIAADSIIAIKIKANEITGDKLVINAVTAREIATDAITAAKIKAGEITGNKLVANTITALQIASTTITANEIATNAITSDKILANSIIAGKIATDAVTADKIFASSITAIKIATDAVTADKILANSIIAGKIATNAVTANEIAADSIIAIKIKANEITGDKLVINAVTAREIATDAITAAKIKAGEITGNKLVANTITALQIAGGTITATEIKGGTITATEIATDAITASKIKAGEVIAGKLAANSVVAANIVANQINAGQIATNTITATQIAGGTITANEIASNAITAVKIKAGEIAAGHIATGAIITSKLDAGAITAEKIATDAITANKIKAGEITGAKLVAGTITANELAVYSITASKLALASSNFAYNPDMVQGTLGFTGSSTSGWTDGVFQLSAVTGAPDGFTALMISGIGTPAAGEFSRVSHRRVINAAGTLDRYQVTAGVTYEFSACLSARRCNGNIAAAFYDASGASLGGWIAGTVVTSGVQTGGSVTAFPKSTLITVAPAGSVSVMISYVATSIGQASPALYLSAPMYAAAVPGQTECSPYVDVSVTIMDGGNIRTKTLSADALIANSITAAQLAVDAVTAASIKAGEITGAKMVAGAIDTLQLAAGAITAVKIASNTITANEIKGGTITANEIAGATITAAQIAGTTITGDKIAGRTILAGNIKAGEITAAEIKALTITSDQIKGRTITAAEIATNTITATEIASRTITAGLIKAGEITANEIKANSITTGVIQAGAITTTELAAGAISADKLGVGLNTGNLLFNSDFLNGMANWSSQMSGGNSWVIDPDRGPTGLSVATVGNAASVPNSGAVAETRYNRITAAGTLDEYLPVTQLKRYEFHTHLVNTGGITLSLIITPVNADASVSYTSTSFIFGTDNLPRSLFSASLARIGGFVTIPAGATKVRIRIRFVFDGVARASSVFITGVYAGLATANQTEVTDWTPMGNTVIDGGAIATNSITARAIAASTITGDLIAGTTITGNKIVGGTITTTQLAASVLTADNITVGAGLLSNWVAGPTKTTIAGGAIEANTILANTLKIGARGVSVRGIEFQAERSAGALTGNTTWTGGTIVYIGDTGTSATATIAAGSAGSTLFYIYWIKGETLLRSTGNINVVYNNADAVMMCVTSAAAGLMPIYGGTVIDGTKITALSIAAGQIAANAIQSDKIAANAILASHIKAGEITADMLYAGTISASGDINLGSTRFRLSATNERLSVVDQNGIVRVQLGGLNSAKTSYGLILRDADNKIMLDSGGIAASAITGGIADSQLAGGGGFNQIYNPECAYGTSRVSVDTPVSVAQGGPMTLGTNLESIYTLRGGYTNFCRADNVNVNFGTTRVVNIAMCPQDYSRHQAEGGKTYEFSMYLAGHRSRYKLVMVFCNNKDEALLNVDSGGFVTGRNNSLTYLNDYDRLSCIGTAPAGTQNVYLIIQMAGTAQPNPYVWWTRMFYGEARPGQTTPSPWNGAGSASPTYISSLVTDTIKTNSLSALGASIGDLTAGVLRAPNNKLVIDLNSGYIQIND